jgi:hypothetical protein
MKRLLVALFIGLASLSLSSITALQVDMINAGVMDSVGKPLANGYVYFYENNSGTTVKAVYSNATKTTTVAQPIRTNSSGIPILGGVPITVFADGTYKIVVKNSSGATIRTLNGVQYNTQADFGGIYIDVATNYGTSTAALSNAIADYTGTGNVTFLFKTGTYTVNSNLVFPSNVSMKFMNGAVMSIANGYSVSVSGSIEATSQQIFSGTGTAVISTANNPIILSAWKNGTDGAVDVQNVLNTTTLNATMLNATMLNATMSIITTLSASFINVSTANIESISALSLSITGNVRVVGTLSVSANTTLNTLVVTGAATVASIATDGQLGLKMKYVTVAVDGASGTSTFAHGLTVGNIVGMGWPSFTDSHYYCTNPSTTTPFIQGSNMVVVWTDSAGGGSPGCTLGIILFYI